MLNTEDGKPPCTLQAIVDNLPLGETHALAQRIGITFGVSDKAAGVIAERLRGRLEQMIYRTRRKIAGRQYKTEVMYTLNSAQDAIFVVAACTRTK